MSTPSEDIDLMLTELQNPKAPLTTWELDFLSSVSDQFGRVHRLSERQVKTLERIHRTRCIAGIRSVR